MNLRPSGYEPDELARLLYLAIMRSRVEPRYSCLQSVAANQIPRQAVTPGGGIPLGEGMRNPCGAVRTNHMMVSSP